MSTQINVNSNILAWAIARAGFDRGEFTTRFPAVGKWLKGKKIPTVKQLKKIAKKAME